MEFCEKLQALRKQQNITQEELAEKLYVSRTAISKWESGRGYPNIESLKVIAAFFSITVDELLSGSEALTIAEHNNKQSKKHIVDIVFGLLDIGISILLFFPFFAQRVSGAVQSVSLLSLTQTTLCLRVLYIAVVIAIVILGIATLALQHCQKTRWLTKLSLLLGIIGVLLFTASLQPYAAALLFIFLIIKMILFIKQR